MDMAHRIVALQERTPSAPLLSPVAFSILLKGYGKLGDLYNVDMLLGHADIRGIKSDTIMMNSLIDAYINCGEYDKAQGVFDFMKSPSPESVLSIEYPTLFAPRHCPSPSRRTFNIMLKGLARRGMLPEAQSLADEMKRGKLWDHVTTNTLVQAAVKAHEFDIAEEILEHYTIENKKPGQSHPNAEAYTSAVDGLAKEGNIGKALELLKRMKSRGVDPNEFTYTCIIGAIAKSKKFDQAMKMLQYMKAEGIEPRVVTYNALVSGLVHREGPYDDPHYDRHVDDAMTVLKQMMKEGVYPNAVTVSVVVGGFGKCDRPRVTEALALIQKLEDDGIVRKGNLRVSTAIIQLLGAAGNFDDALAHFGGLGKPDVASINSILDVCVRCNKDQFTMKIFEESFQGPKASCRPDVISYSSVITSALKKVSYEGSKDARKLYEEMKFRRRISPDNALVDM
jgi:pentatricopeptide repeat protein